MAAVWGRRMREVLANALIHADYHGRRGIVIDKYPKRLEVSNPGALRVSKSVAIAGGTSDAGNGKIFNIFSLVRIGERAGMGISSLYGVWKHEKFAQPSIAESYEPDRTNVTVESEAAEVGVETSEVKEKTAEVGVKTSKGRVKTAEVGVETAEVGVEFDVLMGAYRNDFRENARRVLAALAKNPEMDFGQVSKAVNISENIAPAMKYRERSKLVGRGLRPRRNVKRTNSAVKLLRIARSAIPTKLCLVTIFHCRSNKSLGGSAR